MSQKEAPRVGLLKALVARRVTGREVATALDVTVRQVWRLKGRFASAGAEGLLHRSRRPTWVGCVRSMGPPGLGRAEGPAGAVGI